jgi:hypothetical protein
MFNTILNQHRQVIGIFSSREEAGLALDRLVFSGFAIAKLFLLGQDWGKYVEKPSVLKPSANSFGAITGTTTGLKKGMIIGNLVGGTTGLLLGAGLIALPGVGQLILTSAIAFTLLSGGVCTAAGGLAGALIGLGITSKQAQAYSQQVSQGSFLLIVEGTLGEIDRARHLLEQG